MKKAQQGHENTRRALHRHDEETYRATGLVFVFRTDLYSHNKLSHLGAYIPVGYWQLPVDISLTFYW